MTAVLLLIAAVLGSVAATRIWRRGRFATTGGRAVTLLISCLCLTTMVSPNVVSAALDRGSGIPSLSLLVQCLLSLSTTAAVVLALPDLAKDARRLRRHLLLTGVAAASMAIAFVLVPERQEDPWNYWADLVTPLRSGPTALPAICFWLLYVTAMAHGLLLAVPVLHRHQRSVSTRRVRVALQSLTGALVSTLLYLLFGSVVVLLRAMGWHNATLNAADSAMRVVTFAIGPLLIGGLICISVPINRSVEVLRSYYYLRQLRPMWRDMTRAAPVFDISGRRTVRQPFGDVRLRLYRTVIEIRDGFVAISPWYSEELAARVASCAGAPEKDAVVVATCWELARRAALRGEPQAVSTGAPPSGAATLTEEIALLREIARHRRQAHRLADRCAGEAAVGAQSGR
ncbi:hypothetical protein SAMN05444157_1218 [Frankineae bacterium MT45]|nr:hypothetical protein SAMN05444157_1218 [Frankineae bacterium MT45]